MESLNMPEPERERLYYSISEVSDMLDVKPHVLRYWETQFRTLRPKKGRSGARMYRAKDVDILRSIRELLYDRRYTIEGARKKLDPNEPEPETMETAEPEIEFLAPGHREKLRTLRSELLALRNWLQSRQGD